MQFSWNDRENIAEALNQSYPDAERLDLSLDALRGLVTGLPGFCGPPEPPGAAHLESILWTWMRLADASPVADPSPVKGSA